MNFFVYIVKPRSKPTDEIDRLIKLSIFSSIFWSFKFKFDQKDLRQPGQKKFSKKSNIGANQK